MNITKRLLITKTTKRVEDTSSITSHARSQTFPQILRSPYPTSVPIGYAPFTAIS